MRISVIIPTYNGVDKLPNIIRALESQSIKDIEIIISVDGSTDGTLDYLESVKKRFDDFLIHVQQNRGRSAIRNAGSKAAKGDLLVFFDDDMIPEMDCLLIHKQHHERHPDTILTGAQIDVDNQELSEIQRFKALLSRKWSAPLRKMEDIPLTIDNLFLTAANFSIPRKLFEALGGFDENLSDAEDFDLAIRAFNSGVQLYFNYNAFAWHNDVITGRSYVRRLRQYRRAHQRLQELKPDLYKDVKQLEAIQPSGIKGKLFHFFAKRYWVEWLDKKSWKYLLPKAVRYKLYDLIITANGVYYPEKVFL